MFGMWMFTMIVIFIAGGAFQSLKGKNDRLGWWVAVVVGIHWAMSAKYISPDTIENVVGLILLFIMALLMFTLGQWIERGIQRYAANTAEGEIASG